MPAKAMNFSQCLLRYNKFREIKMTLINKVHRTPIVEQGSVVQN